MVHVAVQEASLRPGKGVGVGVGEELVQLWVETGYMPPCGLSRCRLSWGREGRDVTIFPTPIYYQLAHLFRLGAYDGTRVCISVIVLYQPGPLSADRGSAVLSSTLYDITAASRFLTKITNNRCWKHAQVILEQFFKNRTLGVGVLGYLAPGNKASANLSVRITVRWPRDRSIAVCALGRLSTSSSVDRPIFTSAASEQR